MRRGIVLAFAGCWTAKAPSEAKPMTQMTQQQERRAILRIDAQPTGKKFQGVWLELVDGTKWIVDYRPRDVWMLFRDREVFVTGGCYQPIGEAISATHFRIDRMRDARPERGTRPYITVGPQHVVRGQLVSVSAPPGSKLAESPPQKRFRSERGVTYGVIGAALPEGETVRVRARELEPDMSYTARSIDRDLWISDVLGSDEEEHAPREIPCPR